jgi:hypothetical protein
LTAALFSLCETKDSFWTQPIPRTRGIRANCARLAGVSKSTVHGPALEFRESISWHKENDMASKNEIDAECGQLCMELEQNEQECAKAGEDILSAELSPLLQQRRAIQRQLEILANQCTQLEQLEMVERTQLRAVTSDLVIRATALRNLQDLAMHHYRLLRTIFRCHMSS